MRRTIIGMALGLVLIAVIACSGGSGTRTDPSAPPTSTPPAARAIQPAIAPDLQDTSETEDVSGSSGPKQGGVIAG